MYAPVAISVGADVLPPEEYPTFDEAREVLKANEEILYKIYKPKLRRYASEPQRAPVTPAEAT